MLGAGRGAGGGLEAGCGSGLIVPGLAAGSLSGERDGRQRGCGIRSRHWKFAWECGERTAGRQEADSRHSQGEAQGEAEDALTVTVLLGGVWPRSG